MRDVVEFEFRKELEKSDNIYGRVSDIVKAARSLSNEHDNKMLHSEAITHVISGTKPDRNYKYDFQDEYEACCIKEMFSQIDDKEICNAVYDSFYTSKPIGDLQFQYNDITDSARMSRVRILTRMLWYTLVK